MTDRWQPTNGKPVNHPGPGEYNHKDMADTASKNGHSFGAPFKKDSNNGSPGPGHYDTNKSLMYRGGNTTRVGSVENRPDHFVSKGAREHPGPQHQYDTVIDWSA